jgi:hypothetical protein
MIEAHDGAPVQLNETEQRVLKTLRSGPLGVPEITAEFKIRGRSGSLQKALDRLGTLKLISLTSPDKPRSKNDRSRLF